MAFAQKESYIRRTFELANKAFKASGKNPCVGAILVYKKTIIGEGYYEKYGGTHAEVNCINSVAKEHLQYINKSTLYVSLEPCSIYGKTPPCANFIVRHGIPHVVISCTDPNPKVEGNGIKILRENGVKVDVGILKTEGENLIRKFKTNILKKRSFIALKWAQSKEAYAGKKDTPVWYTNEYSKIIAHKLRSQFDSILIGSNTVNLDNPSLDNRYYKTDKESQNPIKIIIDRAETCKKESTLFHEGEKCIIYTYKKEYINPNQSNCEINIVNQGKEFWLEIFQDLYEKGISSTLVEGGPTIQKSIIKSNLWDEAHVLSSNASQSEGIKAPRVTGHLLNRLLLEDNKYDHIIQQ